MRVVCESDEQLEGTLHVRAEGRLDALGSGQFLESISDRIDASCPAVLIDMCKVDYMSSAGLGILVQLLSRARRVGGSLCLYGCSSRVRAILKVVNLEPVLNVRETVQEARERLKELGIGGEPPPLPAS
jgi:anti-anti-sigma factor